MKILFIYSMYKGFTLEKPVRRYENVQFGISYLSSYLKKHNHQTDLIVLSSKLRDKNQDIIDRVLIKFHPNVVCFTSVATEFQFIANIAKYIKNKYHDLYMVIGGPHVSLNPEEILSYDFDALCIGEGEKPLVELVGQLEKGAPSCIPNLWIKSGKNIQKNPTRPFFQNLDSLPFPDREIWKKWIYDQGGSISVLLGRGCPFQCAYCCNHSLSKLASGSYVRVRSPGNIIEELKELNEKMPGTTEYYLEIETIGVSKKWTLEMCSKLVEFNATLKKPVSFAVNLRIAPNIDLETIFAAFKRANITTINIGLESGSKRIRKEVLKRDYSNKDIINAVHKAREYGLRVLFYNLIGIPGETPTDIMKTIAMNRICTPDKYDTSIFYPYPGTDLYILCRKNNLIPKEMHVEGERKIATLNLPGLTKKQIQMYYFWFDYLVYGYYKLWKDALRQSLFYFFGPKSFLVFNDVYNKLIELVEIFKQYVVYVLKYLKLYGIYRNLKSNIITLKAKISRLKRLID